VYWRRRALVLAALLALVLFITYACSDTSGSKGSPRAEQTSPAPAPSVTEPSASTTLLTPTIENPQSASAPQGGAPGNSCADAELNIIPVPDSASVKYGMPTKFNLRIRNVSARTCTRDVGADVQELYLQQNGAKVWSSDCGGKRGNDVVTFPPGHEQSYYVNWDARGTTAECAAGAPLQPGAYQLFGRLGAKVGGPVTVTIVA
jgi:hypothetical protein